LIILGERAFSKKNGPFPFLFIDNNHLIQKSLFLDLYRDLNSNREGISIMSDALVTGDVFDDETGYQTCDLYLAAFFLSAGCKMAKSFRDAKTRRVYFHFEKNPIMMELKLKYFSREAKVDALTFADNIKSLKSLCHNILNITVTK